MWESLSTVVYRLQHANDCLVDGQGDGVGRSQRRDQ
jgi:hypothetical protein